MARVFGFRYLKFPNTAYILNAISWLGHRHKLPFFPGLQLISDVCFACCLRRIFKTTGRSVQEDVNLLHASVLSMVEFDDDIFAAGNCFDWNEHPAQPGLFCPFAYRLPPPNLGAVFAKDLAMEYHYLGNTSEWFFLARKNAEKVIARNEQYLKCKYIGYVPSDLFA